MKEKEVLKRINSRMNGTGQLTPVIIEQLLQEEKSVMIRPKFNIFARLFRQKSNSQIIKDNFLLILNKTEYSKLNTLMKNLLQNAQTNKVVEANFGAIMKRYNALPISERKDKETKGINETKSRFLKLCKKELPNADELFLKYIDIMIQGPIALADLSILKGLSEKADEKLNTKLESAKSQIAREMLYKGLRRMNAKERAQKQQLIDDYVLTMITIVEELLAEQHLRMVDIKTKMPGGYCTVYQIGEKVLKIGAPRKTYKIPNHPRILQPLTRTNLIDERDNNRICYCVEISDYVEELCYEDREEEKLYQLYKELRDDGIIWTDAKYSNVGKLKKENIPTLSGQKMDVDPQAIGMKGKCKKVLGVGEWVIFDTDFIYEEGDISIIWVENSFSERFEKRWLQEKQEEVAKKFRESIKIVSEGKEELSK